MIPKWWNKDWMQEEWKKKHPPETWTEDPIHKVNILPLPSQVDLDWSDNPFTGEQLFDAAAIFQRKSQTDAATIHGIGAGRHAD